MSNRALVTGGAGFIGSHLVDKLLEENFEVSVVDNLATGMRENVNKRAKFYKNDIRDKSLLALVQKISPDYIFHLAAQASVPVSLEKPVFDTEVNVLGSVNVLEAARLSRVKKIVFTSSGGAIYGDAEVLPTPESEPPKPLSPYAEAKFTVERYLKIYQERFGLPFVALRFANVYGPRQTSSWESGVISIFIRQILQDKILTVHGDGQQTRDFVYVSDVVAALHQASQKGHGIYNIGTSEQASILTLVKILGQVAGVVPKVTYTKARGDGDVRDSSLHFGLAKKDLSWQPKVDLSAGLKQTYSWFREMMA